MIPSDSDLMSYIRVTSQTSSLLNNHLIANYHSPPVATVSMDAWVEEEKGARVLLWHLKKILNEEGYRKRARKIYKIGLAVCRAGFEILDNLEKEERRFLRKARAWVSVEPNEYRFVRLNRLQHHPSFLKFQEEKKIKETALAKSVQWAIDLLHHPCPSLEVIKKSQAGLDCLPLGRWKTFLGSLGFLVLGLLVFSWSPAGYSEMGAVMSLMGLAAIFYVHHQKGFADHLFDLAEAVLEAEKKARRDLSPNRL